MVVNAKKIPKKERSLEELKSKSSLVLATERKGILIMERRQKTNKAQ